MHPLDCKDIKLLFDRSDRYVIPRLQTHAKRSGLVLYNKEGRYNAEDEAIAIEGGLKSGGFYTQKREWEDASELIKLINQLVNELLKSGLSLLVISIMSHGTIGMIRGHRYTKVSISDILHALTLKLPAHIPLVSVSIYMLLIQMMMPESRLTNQYAPDKIH